MSLSVIIPSRNLDNLISCIAAVRRHELNVRIIVVDDGLRAQFRGTLLGRLDTIPGVKPFVYARNCNLGIAASGDDDVILLNDDALLQTPGGFTAMSDWALRFPCGHEFSRIDEICWSTGKTHREAPEGVAGRIVGPLTNCSGNPEQIAQAAGPVGVRRTSRALPFLCVFIPRRVIDAVGLLDERFTAYGFEDDDYCRRARLAGVETLIYEGCFVDHLSLPSTFRGAPGAPGDIREGQRIYREKWEAQSI